MYFGTTIQESIKESDKPVFEFEIDFSDIDMLKEETVDDSGLPGKGNAKICIYSGEGPVAHFHIEAPGFYSCVKLDSIEYFDHNGKYKDKLNNKQVKALKEKLSKISKDDNVGKFTLYEIMVDFWNRYNHEGKPVLRNRDTMPDYENLNK